MTEKRQIAISLPSTGDEEWQAVRDPLNTGWLTQGPRVANFEEAFAKRHRVKYAIATTSCTTALHLMLAAAGIGSGDEVIVPAFTWVATANAVLYCGAIPIFVDVNPATNNIAIEDLSKRITSKTKAVIAVHLFGLCVDIPSIRSILPSRVLLFEDCACAAGASLNGIPAGGLADAGAFSFHPRKSITTGEGGMVTTNNEVLAEKINMLRNHGASISEEQRLQGSHPYLLPDFNLLGFNYRMTDIQGAIGLVQLSKLDKFIAERDLWAQFYRENLSDIPWLRMPYFPDHDTTIHAWQAFVTYVDPVKSPMSRNEIMDRLQAQGIATRPGTHAVHMLGYYRDRFGLKPNDYVGARNCNNNTMAIPLHNLMTSEDYEYVVKSLKDIGS